ncbi:MAG: response regulator, partial [Planctomycetota bacterium]
MKQTGASPIHEDPAATEPVEGGPLSQLTIYLVDPDEEQQRVVERATVGRDTVVRQFRSARTFLEEFVDAPRSCVVLEENLSDASGTEVLRELRSRSSDVPVLFAARGPSSKVVVRCLKMGACDFFEKPVSSIELSAAIESAVEQDRQRRAEMELRDSVMQ